MVFLWDDDNTAHLEDRHPDVAPTDVDSIWDRRVVTLPNRSGTASVLFLGIDRHDRLLAIPADPAGPTTWRPKTAHPAKTAWQRNAYYRTDHTKGAAQ